MKNSTPSPLLAKIVGPEPRPRTEITQRLWLYIKSHKLQDPNSKRFILPDADLKAVLGKDSVSMFELPKLISPHLT